MSLNSKIRIWHISDTHSYHGYLKMPKNVDIVIHSGDAGNARDQYRSEPEIRNFAIWYANLPIMYKVYIAGNHDSSLENNFIDKKYFDKLNIDYLFNDSIDVMGLKIWGSPYTPQFGNWSFMKNRAKIGRVWDTIPDDTDILVTHGPPKGILDVSEDRNRQIEFCGDSALNKRILKLNCKLICFGHIHNMDDIKNAGVFIPSNTTTIYSNGSCVTDGKFGKIDTMSNGNLFEVDLVTKEFNILAW